MSSHLVKHGQTYTLTGTLGTHGTLTALSGNPGGVIDVIGSARNDGTIVLKGAQAAHRHGASLDDQGTLKNTGVISVGGATTSPHGALLQVYGVLTNSGTLIAAAGTHGAGGVVSIGPTGRIRNDGTLTLAAGATAGSSGATLIDSGVLTNSTTGTININGAPAGGIGAGQPGSGGSLAIAGTLTNDGTLNLYGGANGYGFATVAASAGTLSVLGVATNAGSIRIGVPRPNYYAAKGALFAVAGVLTNTGTVSVAGGTTGYNGYGRPSTLAIAGLLVNQGQISLQSGGIGGLGYPIFSQAALLQDSGTLDNYGTLIVGGYGFGVAGATMMVDGTLMNAGTIEQQADSYTVVGGTVINSGVINAYGAQSASLYGTAYDGRGGHIRVNGVFFNDGTITLNGGLTGMSSPPILAYNGFGATLSVVGSVFNDGTIAVAGGNAAYAGSPYGHGYGAELAIASRYGGIFNSNLIEIQQGATSSYGASGAGGVLVDAGALGNTFKIEISGGIGTAAGTLQVSSTGVLANGGQIYGTGVLLNQGLINAGYFVAGSIAAGLTFVNDGTLLDSYRDRVASVSSNISTDAGQTGRIELFYQSTLALNGSVGAGQLVSFKYGGNDLQLGDASAFAGTLSGLAATDVLDFLHQDVTSAIASGDTLAIGLSTGTTLDLALAAPLSGLALTLQTDGQGGTDVLFATGH